MPGHTNRLYGAVANQVNEIQDVAVSDDVVSAVLTAITSGVVNTVRGAQFSGISVVENGELASVAATDEIATHIDDLQAKHSVGPCLEATWPHRVIRIDDYSTLGRWPSLVGDVVAQTPVRSSVAVQLYRDDTTRCVLAMHGTVPHAFDCHGQRVAMAFAAQAALALHNQRKQRQFDLALASRDEIGQAKGILMERYDIGAGRAYAMLQKLSQDTNVRVAELARRLVAIDHPDDS